MFQSGARRASSGRDPAGNGEDRRRQLEGARRLPEDLEADVPNGAPPRLFLSDGVSRGGPDTGRGRRPEVIEVRVARFDEDVLDRDVSQLRRAEERLELPPATQRQSSVVRCRRAASQKVRASAKPFASNVHAATTPPGRTTRAISAMV